jgi:hypothetical protein
VTKDDLLAPPAAIDGFNGFHARSGKFIMMNSMRILIAWAVLAAVALAALVVMTAGCVRRRRRQTRLSR